MRYLIVLSVLLLGCTATNWAKDGATSAELDADYRSCNKAANEGGPGAAALFGAIGVAARTRETNEKIRGCMRQKGWHAQN